MSERKKVKLILLGCSHILFTSTQHSKKFFWPHAVLR